MYVLIPFFWPIPRNFANLVKPCISFFKIINHQDSNGLSFFSVHSRFQNSFENDFKLFSQKIESAIPCKQFSRFWFHWLFDGSSFNQYNCLWVFHVILRIVTRAGKKPGIGWSLDRVFKLNGVDVGRRNRGEQDPFVYIIYKRLD